ncbi:replication initiator protein A, partial [Xanthobacter versatilis]|uniref:replication initiator protein A n=1 Tax=Xanthobacter autotrophicus (strain ATCC BAA-1158 / Py2) TaxID=78245 RepID=UPI0037283303
AGWRFDFRHLYLKSGSLSPFKRFAFELRDIIRRQPLPGYTLFLECDASARTLLAFEPACGQPVNPVVPSGTRCHVPSGTGPSCFREPKQGLTPSSKRQNRAPNLDSNRESNFKRRAGDVDNRAQTAQKPAHLSTSKGECLPSFRKDGLQAPEPLPTADLPPASPSGGRR